MIPVFHIGNLSALLRTPAFFGIKVNLAGETFQLRAITQYSFRFSEIYELPQPLPFGVQRVINTDKRSCNASAEINKSGMKGNDRVDVSTKFFAAISLRTLNAPRGGFHPQSL